MLRGGLRAVGRAVRVCHGFDADFDDPNLVSCAGLAPLLQLAERVVLEQLTAHHVRIGKPGGAPVHLKIPALIAGMVAGAGSIEDMDLLAGASGELVLRADSAYSAMA
ncbi:MAG: hypothetical protein NVS3B26_17410 [Mycobacteriales bacterium]